MCRPEVAPVPRGRERGGVSPASLMDEVHNSCQSPALPLSPPLSGYSSNENRPTHAYLITQRAGCGVGLLWKRGDESSIRG